MKINFISTLTYIFISIFHTNFLVTTYLIDVVTPQVTPDQGIPQPEIGDI